MEIVLRLAAHAALWSISHACDHLRQSKLHGPCTTEPTAARSSFVQLAKEYRAPSDDTHETTVIASPVLFPLYTCQFPHQISAPFFSEVFSFSLSKGSVDNRCGSMREKINSKLNCHDQYFVSLLPEQRLTKDRAIPSVPSIRCSGG